MKNCEKNVLELILSTGDYNRQIQMIGEYAAVIYSLNKDEFVDFLSKLKKPAKDIIFNNVVSNNIVNNDNNNNNNNKYDFFRK